MQDLKITIVQPKPAWHAVEKNLAYLSSLIGSKSPETDVIALPEMFTTGFTMDSSDMAEHMHGRTHTWMQEEALKIDAAICGSIIIQENGEFYNRFLWVEPGGKTAIYDKRHLFRMADENKFYSEGTQPVDISYKGFKIRPQICYDLRFPVWARNSVTNNAFAYDILLYVANWPAARISAWTSLLQARAIENHAYCLGVNRVGEDEKGINYNGQSIAFSPKGNMLVKMGNTEGFQTITLNGKSLADYRKQFPVHLDADNFNLDL